MEASVRTSGPLLSNLEPSLVQVTLLTGPPDELQVREKLTSTDSCPDVRWKAFVRGITIAIASVHTTIVVMVVDQHRRSAVPHQSFNLLFSLLV